MLEDFGIWIALVFPIVIGVTTALILAFSSGRQKPEPAGPKGQKRFRF